MKSELKYGNGKPIVYPTVERLPQNLGVLVIDMQPYFLDLIEQAKREEMIRAQLEVLGVCARKDIPTFVLYVYHDRNRYGHTIPEINNMALKIPRKKDIPKQERSGFERTNLNGYLTELNIENLCLMGVNASVCVRETAVDALKYRKKIISAEQLIADNEREIKDGGGPFNGISARTGIEFYAKNSLAFFKDYKDLVRLMNS